MGKNRGLYKTIMAAVKSRGSGKRDKILHPFRILIIAYRKFMTDDCLTRASAIAYTAIMSLIPALTVVLSIYSIFSGGAAKKDDLFREISLFMIEHNLNLNVDPIFEAISSLITNAGKVGGVGAAVVIFSATAMLRAMEESLNKIFHVRVARSMVMRIVYYWAALTLGPVMLIAGTTVAKQVSETLSSPTYFALASCDNNIIAAGSKSTIERLSLPDLTSSSIEKESIDYLNQEIYAFDENGTARLRQEQTVDSLELSKVRFTDMAVIDNQCFIISNRGIIIRGNPRERKWSIQKYDTMGLNSISVTNNNQIFIAAQNGLLLTAETPSAPLRAMRIADRTTTFHDTAFSSQMGIAVGTRGTVAISQNGGQSWNTTSLDQALRFGKHVDLNAVSIDKKGTILITGNDGVILFSSDQGATWEERHFRELNYNAALLIDGNRAYIGGSRGAILYTENAGNTWQLTSAGTSTITMLTRIDTTIWAGGTNGFLNKKPLSQGDWTGKRGSPVIVFILNFLAPFTFIWLLFVILYTAMPNTRVPLKNAGAGAAFTATVWVLFIMFFIVYTRSFANSTFAIYGALAAIPLFLLMIYSSTVIFLLGAEVAAVSMSPERYAGDLGLDMELNGCSYTVGFSIIMTVYDLFESGQGPSTKETISKKTGITAFDVNRCTDIFVEEEILAYDDNGRLIPTRSSENLLSREIIELMGHHNYSVPLEMKNGPVKKYLKEIVTILKEAGEKVLPEKTVKDMIDTAAGKGVTGRNSRK